MEYSSPQSLLNKHFKKQKKFLYVDDEYLNKDFQLTWIEGEVFVLSARITDSDTGADYYDDVTHGLLSDLVGIIKEFYKTGHLT
jgi:hypothetical protein